MFCRETERPPLHLEADLLRDAAMPTLNILSWNLEHMRAVKLERNQNPATFSGVVRDAHVAFFYESKTLCGDTARDIMRRTTGDNSWTSANFVCHGADSEVIVCLWRSTTVESVRRHNAKQVEINGRLTTGQRPPVALKVEIRNGPRIVVAPWHAAGPANNVAQELFDRIRKVEDVDLVFGDFNWQAPFGILPPSDLPDYRSVGGGSKKRKAPDEDDTRKQARGDDGHGGQRRSFRLHQKYHLFEAIEKNAQNQSVYRTSTFTSTGPTSRNSPIDRCFVERSLYGNVRVKITRDVPSHATWNDLTNHYPLWIYLDY